MNPVQLLRKWLKPGAVGGYTRYHPKVTGFELALRGIRRHASDTVHSTAIIALPFPVQLNIEEKSHLWFQDADQEDTKVVLVTLKGGENDYGLSTMHGSGDSQFEKV